MLNDPAYASGSILFAGPDFGTGSSREHAVWALRDYGFRAVLRAAVRRHLPRQRRQAGPARPACCTEDVIATCWAAIEADPGTTATVDLQAGTVTLSGETHSFEIDAYTRWRLLEGLDDIGLTLRDEARITQFESGREAWRPQTLPVRER